MAYWLLGLYLQILLTTSFSFPSSSFQNAYRAHTHRHTAMSISEPISNTVSEEPQWDAKLGVWVGNLAPSTSPLPSPLYILGYGSLIWRPGGDSPGMEETLRAVEPGSQGNPRVPRFGADFGA
ncbi:hypothetical protein B484DRAFT_158868 [Ochromonadaceae sp. CCMP2298]|nr:hypothetical protein B484DRAFT_158868 [Ochromonadaceae sp. CCMP2298]